MLYTLDLFAKKHNLTKNSALNKLSKLKKQGYVKVSGGGPQVRIYEVSNKIIKKTNGFYDLVNKYSPNKLSPRFKHYVYGKPYSTEKAIIDGILMNDVRTNEAIMHLFRHITNWKELFHLAKKNNCTNQLHQLYQKARKTTKCKRMPKRYEK